jgi:hypothetical protein
MANKSLMSTMSDKVGAITREAGALIGSIATPAKDAAEAAFARATGTRKAKRPRRVATKRASQVKAKLPRKVKAVKRTVRRAAPRRARKAS